MKPWISFLADRWRAFWRAADRAWRAQAEVNYRYRFWMLG